MKVAKKQRANCSEEKISTSELEPTKRGGRTRRAKRAQLEEEEKEKPKPSLKTAPIPSEDNAEVVLDDLLLVEDTVIKGKVKNCLHLHIITSQEETLGSVQQIITH